jgi:glycosyltransferase involved in cell wall biosynthesis
MIDQFFFVVIATAHREGLLSRTLRSLSACHKPSRYEATIVVENGPKGEAERVVERFRDPLSTRYLYVERANKSDALNEALSTVDQGLIFFTDDDVRLHPDTLQAYARAADGKAGGYFYGGPTGVDYQQPPAAWLKKYLPPSATGLQYDVDAMGSHGLSLFLGCNWAAFAADLRRAGGFDPDFGPGSPTGSRGQETQMHRRLWELGVHQVYVPNAKVWHYVPKIRCSPRWALRRAYQGGVQQGLRARSQAVSLLGLPLWMMRAWLGKALNAARAMVTHHEEKRFVAYRELSQYTGFLRGVWLRRTRSADID